MNKSRKIKFSFGVVLVVFATILTFYISQFVIDLGLNADKTGTDGYIPDTNILGLLLAFNFGLAGIGLVIASIVRSQSSHQLIVRAGVAIAVVINVLAILFLVVT